MRADLALEREEPVTHQHDPVKEVLDGHRADLAVEVPARFAPSPALSQRRSRQGEAVALALAGERLELRGDLTLGAFAMTGAQEARTQPSDRGISAAHLPVKVEFLPIV
jgi:hypothetical protein